MKHLPVLALTLGLFLPSLASAAQYVCGSKVETYECTQWTCACDYVKEDGTGSFGQTMTPSKDGHCPARYNDTLNGHGWGKLQKEWSCEPYKTTCTRTVPKYCDDSGKADTSDPSTDWTFDGAVVGQATGTQNMTPSGTGSTTGTGTDSGSGKFGATTQNPDGTFSYTPSSDNELTGDVRLACEAILCLSTGSPPSECNPSLDRYFGIEIWECDDGCWIDWSATLEARLNFLNQCPAVDEKESSAQMHSLTNAIVHGARQCTAEILNSQNKKYKECGGEPVCVQYENFASEAEELFYNQNLDNSYNRRCLKWEKPKKRVISSDMPKNCVNYVGHEFTDFSLHYVGDECNGGKWVD